MTKAKATLATIYPTTGVFSWFFSCFVKTVLEDKGEVFDGHVLAKESGPNLDINRNYIVEKFLRTMPNRDWLMFVDSDEKWEVTDMYDFIKRANLDPEKTPVVSGLYRRIDYANNTLSYAFWHLDGTPVPLSIAEETDYVRVGAVPAGALLMHRSALVAVQEKFGDEWFSTYSPGMREDMAFCDRLAMLDIPVHIDPRFKVTHIKLMPIPGG